MTVKTSGCQPRAQTGISAQAYAAERPLPRIKSPVQRRLIDDHTFDVSTIQLCDNVGTLAYIFENTSSLSNVRLPAKLACWLLCSDGDLFAVQVADSYSGALSVP